MSGSALTETAHAALPFVARAASAPARERVDRASVAAFAGVSLLALFAPFERIAPLVRLPGQSLSNLEAVLLVAAAAWLFALRWERRRPEWNTPLTLPWLALLAAMSCAAVAAPGDRLNALHMVGRIAAAFGVYLLAVNGVTTRARLITCVALVLVGAIGASILAILEYLTIPVVLQWLKAFRPQVMTVGAIVRAGGSLQYPTIASMYLEVAFALGVGLMLAWRDAGRRGHTAVVFAALVVMAYAITLTFTRSGLILMAVTLASIAALRSRQVGIDAGVRLVTALGPVILALFLGSRSLDSIWLRFTTEGQETWYSADIDAPSEVTLTTGSVARILLSITNRGRLDWSSETESPFFLSYHWMVADEERYVVFDGMRTPFASTVSSGATVTMQANVRAPRRPGRYRLVWDVVQERRTWFSDEPDATPAISIATVEGAALSGGLPPFPRPRPGWRPGRLVLWRAAARMFAAHPLLGVGPDNFRLTYARYANIAGADPRTHSNNMYLELLAGGGLVTAVAFAWWLLAGARLCIAGVSRALRDGGAIAFGAAAACGAIAVHGVVDSFLSFAPTYILFSLTLGLAAACARGVETRADAHRI